MALIPDQPGGWLDYAERSGLLALLQWPDGRDEHRLCGDDSDLAFEPADQLSHAGRY